MSDYGFYLRRAREAAGLVSELEAALARAPGDMSLQVNLASATRMADRAEEQLAAAAIESQVDLIRYRLVKRIGQGFGVHGVSRSLDLFQGAVTSIYDAFMGRPKTGGRVGREIKSDSEMIFGYSFAGSLGVVLLAPSEKGLFRTRFDDVAAAITQVFDISDSHKLRDVARKIGPAAVRKLYAWAEANQKEGFDLDLKWTNAAEQQFGYYVATGQFGRLAQLISATSDVKDDRFTSVGALVGFDSVYRTFHFVVPGGDAYKGHLTRDFPQRREHTVNRTYQAIIVTEVTTKFSTGEETVKHSLAELRQIADPGQEAPPK